MNYNKEMDKAIKILEELFIQADEDCPQDCRTMHFVNALEQASEFIMEHKNAK